MGGRTMTKQENRIKVLQEVYYALDNAQRATMAHNDLAELRSLIRDAREKAFELISENDRCEIVYDKAVQMISDYVQSHGGNQPKEIHIDYYNVNQTDKSIIHGDILAWGEGTKIYGDDEPLCCCKSFDDLRNLCNPRTTTKSWYIWDVRGVE